MSNKIIPSIFSVIFLSFFLASALITRQSYNPYKSQAKNWIASYLAHANQEECELVANLFYWSHQRSLMTLKTQKASTNALEAVWFDWNGITRTRRNPALPTPNSVKKNSALKEVKIFEDLKTEYQKTNCIYVICTNALIKEKYLNAELTQALKEIRSDARKTIFNEFLTMPIRSSSLLDDEQEAPTNLFALLKNFWHSLPNLSISSFVEFDKKYVELSSQCWDSFMLAHDQANNIWVTIEDTRIAFYAAHYNALIKHIKINFPDNLPLHSTFDQHGFIAQAKKILELPENL